MQAFRKAIIALFLCFTFTLSLVAGCGSGDSSSSSSSDQEFTGRAVKGPVAFGTVTIYKLNADGSRGGVLATTTTDAAGHFSIRSSYTGLVEAVITGGSYIDEATGQTVDMTGREMSALVTGGVSRGSTVAITPLTNAATQDAKNRIANGEDPTAAINTSNTEVANHFGLSGVDITRVIPHDLTNGTDSALPGEQATNYAAAIAALSQQAKNSGMTPKQALDLAENIGADLSDGSLNGASHGSQLPHSLPVTPSGFLNNIETTADEFLNSSGNNSGVGANEVTLQEGSSSSSGSTTTSSGSSSSGSTTSGGTTTSGGSTTSGGTTTSGGSTTSGGTSTSGGASSSSGGSPPPADTTPPTTTVAFAQFSKTTTTWTGSATINENGTGYCTAITAGQPAPTAAEIKADNNASKVGTGGSVVMTAGNSAQCTVTGLTPTTIYEFYFVAQDSVPNLQSDATAATQKVTAITSTPADVTPPTTTVAWAQNAKTDLTWTGSATISENGTGYCTALIAGSAAPTAAEIKANNNANKVGTGGSTAMAATVTANCTVTGLAQLTIYDFYFAAEDAVPNLQADGTVATQKVTAITLATPDVTPPVTDVAWAQNANTAGTSWTGSASLNEVGTGYCAAVASGGAAPTAAQIKAGAGGGIVGTAGSVAMGTPATTYNCSVTGLTQATAYDFYFVAEDAVPNLQSNATASAQKVTATTPDVTPPTTDVAWSIVTNTSGTTWTGSASLNEAGTGYCAAVATGGAAPTAAQVKAGSGGGIVGTAGSVAMGAPAATYNCTITGLSQNTTYDMYFAAEDAVPNLQSNVTVAAQKVTSTTPDVTPPTTDVAWAQSVNTAGTSWTGTASLNEAGTGYCAAVASGGAAPTAANIKAGSGGGIVGTAGSVAMGTPATTYSCTVTGLTVSTAYDFYFAAEDTALNLQSNFTASTQKVTATTPNPCATTTSASMAGGPFAVADAASVAKTISFAPPAAFCTIADVNFTFTIADDGVVGIIGSDYDVTLTHPDGTAIKLVNNTAGTPFSDSSNGFPAITLDDAAATVVPDCFASPAGAGCDNVIVNGAAGMITGTYRPHTALSGFNGKYGNSLNNNSGGGNNNWTATVADIFNQGTTGNFTAATIQITWQ